MKIIFLDIDGVLNSSEYRIQLGMRYYSEIIDRSKMPLLKKLVEATGANIVLSTSWRKFWKEGEPQPDPAGRYFDGIFTEFGLSVYSKTPVRENAGRDAEIREWLEGKPEVDGYVILDDQDFGWSPVCLSHLVRTDPDGNGLTDEQVQTAIGVLKGRLLPVPENAERKESAFRIWRKKYWNRRT